MVLKLMPSIPAISMEATTIPTTETSISTVHRSHSQQSGLLIVTKATESNGTDMCPERHNPQGSTRAGHGGPVNLVSRCFYT